MQIEVTEQSTKTIELAAPAYYRDEFAFFFLNEDGTLVVVRDNVITYYDKDFPSYTKQVVSLLTNSFPSSFTEFKKAFRKTVEDIASKALCPVITM